ncbi:uncharacterized protein LOC128245229 [Mya arenaria]|uniref:uncharacterized protein LOC128245229 n=1 Tax=Mya arenaria TaxID=6604 RepID=UPI0022E35627|nr:uncharacterized protein LOC128245229 [Mya arenaria]
MYVAVFLVCVGYLVLGCDGGTLFNPITVEMLNGEMSFYCTYKGLKVLPGKSFTDYHACLKCACDGNGLACNTMGFRVAVPEDSECDNVLIGCKNRWVLKSDNTKKCPKKKIPQNISAVGK